MPFMKSREILFLMDSRDSNPNGEREPGMEGPRIDPLTNRAILSDVCLKRILRDYFLVKNKEYDYILMRQEFEYSTTGRVPIKNSLEKDLGTDETALKKTSAEQLYDKISNQFIDHRLFGSIFYLKKQLYATTGPVQFENALSLNIPQIITFAISSTMASEKDKGAGSLGKTSVLNYAILAIHGIIKEALSKKSKATEDDAKKLFDALWNGVSSKITRTKFQQLPRLLISLVMKDHRFQIPHFRDSIKLKNENVSNFKECVLVLDDLANMVEKHANQIECIELREDPFTKYEYGGKKFTSLKDVLKNIPNCPPLQNLTDFY